MTPTDSVIAEMNRCLARMRAYRATKPGEQQTTEHATAARASLDLTRALAAWRKVGASRANEEATR